VAQDHVIKMAKPEKFVAAQSGNRLLFVRYLLEYNLLVNEASAILRRVDASMAANGRIF